jgi:lycopene elongase/hydratase (dihydrobisanhydrobacterioruberin-forming)
MKRPPPLTHLFFNHLDAWGVAVIFAALAMVIHSALSWQTTLLLPAMALGYWAAFALNDYYDAPFDAADPVKVRHNFFVGTAVAPPIIWGVGLAVMALPALALAQFGGRGVAVFCLCLLVMWGYSAPPLRLKSRPGLDLLTHALFVETFPYLACLFLIRATWTPLDSVMVAIAGLSSLTAQLSQQIRDFAVDMANGRTFTTTVGIPISRFLQRAATVALVVVAVGPALLGVLPALFVPFGLIGLPGVIQRLRPLPHPERITALSVLAGLLYTAVVVLIATNRPLP